MEWCGVVVWWWGQLTPSCVHLLPSRPPTPSGCCLKVFKGTKQVKSEKSPLLRKEKVKKRKFPMLCTPPSRPPTPSGGCEDCSKSLKVFKGSKQVKSEKSPLTLSCLHLLVAYLIFVIFLHKQNFWRIFTPKNANFSR